jgi:hypothetical protein
MPGILWETPPLEEKLSKARVSTTVTVSRNVALSEDSLVMSDQVAGLHFTIEISSTELSFKLY